jgi:hypothetical protein
LMNPSSLKTSLPHSSILYFNTSKHLYCIVSNIDVPGVFPSSPPQPPQTQNPKNSTEEINITQRRMCRLPPAGHKKFRCGGGGGDWIGHPPTPHTHTQNSILWLQYGLNVKTSGSPEAGGFRWGSNKLPDALKYLISESSSFR